MLFLLRGKVKLAAVTSFEGKEAIVATLGPGEFFGEGCPGRPAVAHGNGYFRVESVRLQGLRKYR